MIGGGGGVKLFVNLLILEMLAIDIPMILHVAVSGQILQYHKKYY
jgi:hypothetical protein